MKFIVGLIYLSLLCTLVLGSKGKVDFDWLKKFQPDHLLKSAFPQIDPFASLLEEARDFSAYQKKIHNGPPPDWQETLSSFVKTFLSCPKQPIPGIGVVVVQNGEVLFQQGFGYRDLESQLPVDEKTLFGIGSCSKAFTSASMSILKDRGLISSFDDSIAEKYLPWFRTYDSSLSLKVTLRDMMSHRSGVPRNDLITLGGIKWTRSQLIEIFKNFPPNYLFRDTFEYNNYGFVTAGVVLEQITGEKWEDFVQKEIFDKLNMQTSGTSVNQSINTGNYAFPYGLSNGQMKPFSPLVNELIEVMGPAGSINSNLEDLANWLIFLLNRGSFNHSQIVSASNLAEAWKPSMKMDQYYSLSPPYFPVLSTMAAYGMGWWLGSYRDRPILMHGGNTIGHSALAFLSPVDNIGVFVLTNMEGLGTQPLLIALQVMDLLHGYQPWINDTTACTFPAPWIHQQENFQEISHEKKVKISEFTTCVPTLSDYIGTYSHPAYGNIVISMGQTSSTLQFQWGNIMGTSISGENDYFVMQATTPISLDPAFIPVQFNRNPMKQGVVESVAVPLEPTESPIIFSNANFLPKNSCGFPQPILT